MQLLLTLRKDEQILANISLIIPTYNRCELLKVTMPHYLALRNIREILIIDDHGADDTESYISQVSKRNPKVRYIRSEVRRRQPATRNTGLNQVAKDIDYVLFGEDDVIMPPDHATMLLAKMQEYDSDIAGGRTLSIRRGETFEECIARYHRCLERYEGHKKKLRLVNEDLMLDNFAIDRTQPALFLSALSLFRRDVFNNIRFDEAYKHNCFREETDIYLQAKMQGFSTIFVGECNCFHLPKTGGGAHDYGFALSPKLVRLLAVVGLPEDTYSIINNNYFLNKYYDHLKDWCHYSRRKEYYEILFALHLIKRRLWLPVDLVVRRTMGSDAADCGLIANSWY